MHKRKLLTSIEKFKAKKFASDDSKLDILFSDKSVKQPSDVTEAITYIQGLVTWQKFNDKVPAVVLKSQLYALFSDHTKIDGEVNKLRQEGTIVITKLDEGTYSIVIKEQYLKIVKQMMADDCLPHPVAEAFIAFCSEDDLSVEISPKSLFKHFKEGQITSLVRAGFLTSEITGMYYLTIPNASVFLRTLNDGRKVLKGVIKRSKFKEILLQELLQRKLKKTDVLGLTYYCLDIIGSEMVRLTSTTSGPLLRYVDDEC